MRLILVALCLALTACASTPRHVVDPSDVSFSTQAPSDGHLVGRIHLAVGHIDFQSLANVPRDMQEKAANKGGNVIVLDTDAMNIVRDAFSLNGEKSIWCKVYYSPTH